MDQLGLMCKSKELGREQRFWKRAGRSDNLPAPRQCCFFIFSSICLCESDLGCRAASHPGLTRASTFKAYMNQESTLTLDSVQNSFSTMCRCQSVIKGGVYLNELIKDLHRSQIIFLEQHALCYYPSYTTEIRLARQCYLLKNDMSLFFIHLQMP